MRFHVDTAGALEIVRQAINAAWRASPGGSVVTHTFNGAVIGTEPLAEHEARLGLDPTEVVHASRLIVASDGTAALEIPDASVGTGRTAAAIAPLLGRNGIPSAAALVQVTRPREHSRLPAGVRDVLDDRYVDAELDAGDNPAARARVTAELQGARATAALARRDARDSQAALNRAIGLR